MLRWGSKDLDSPGIGRSGDNNIAWLPERELNDIFSAVFFSLHKSFNLLLQTRNPLIAFLDIPFDFCFTDSQDLDQVLMTLIQGAVEFPDPVVMISCYF